MPGDATKCRSNDVDLVVSERDPLSALALLGVRGRRQDLRDKVLDAAPESISSKSVGTSLFGNSGCRCHLGRGRWLDNGRDSRVPPQRLLRCRQCPPGGRLARGQHVERHDDLGGRGAAVVAGLQRSVTEPFVHSKHSVPVVHEHARTRDSGFAGLGRGTTFRRARAVAGARAD